MLALSAVECQAPVWKRQLSEVFTRTQDLLDFLGVDSQALSISQAAARDFPVLVPRGFAALMRRGDPNDPLLRQILPVAEELMPRPGFCGDPVGDRAATLVPGLLQKYRGRALLLITGACAVHCRYCFRRYFPYQDGVFRGSAASSALAHLAQETSICEVILSGGDPLMKDDSYLAALIGQLGSIHHIRRLRVHTRLPIVLPSRITDGLCRTLRDTRLQPVVVIQANHANELGSESRKALSRLHESGITLLSQSVLLRGVNDCARVLKDLCEALFECGVLPYYLHMLDRVSTAAHFEIEEGSANRLLNELRRLLPGYLVPRLVREQAGGAYKVPVQS